MLVVVNIHGILHTRTYKKAWMSLHIIITWRKVGGDGRKTAEFQLNNTKGSWYKKPESHLLSNGGYGNMFMCSPQTLFIVTVYRRGLMTRYNIKPSNNNQQYFFLTSATIISPLVFLNALLYNTDQQAHLLSPLLLQKSGRAGMIARCTR